MASNQSNNRAITAALQRDLKARGASAVRDARAAGNDTLRQVRADVYGRMRSTFDRPTPYTIPAGIAERAGSLLVEYMSQAQGGAPSGELAVRGRGDVGGQAVPHQSYLRAQIDGGARRLKKLEVLLQRRGLMPRGWLAVPGKGARLDAYGNVSRGQVVQVLAFLDAMPSGNKRSNMTDRSRGRLKAKVAGRRLPSKYFVVTGPERSGGLAPGVWESVALGGLGKGVRPVYVFVKAARYQVRLPMDQLVGESVDKWMPRMLARRLGAAR